MAATYAGTGGIVAGQDSGVAVPFPTTVNLNDILFLVMMDADDDSFIIPLGWTFLVIQSVNTNLSYSIFWKRADGTESGTVQCDSELSAGSLVAGIMYRFSGCITSGDPYETVSQSFPSVQQFSTHPYSFSTPSVSGFTAVSFLILEDDTVNGFSGTGWTENNRESTSIGSDGEFAIATIGVSSTSPPDVQWTSSANEYSGRPKFYLIPEPAVDITDVAINISDSWKLMASGKINIGGVWKDIAGIKINIGGVWKDVL